MTWMNSIHFVCTYEGGVSMHIKVAPCECMHECVWTLTNKWKQSNCQDVQKEDVHNRTKAVHNTCHDPVDGSQCMYRIMKIKETLQIIYQLVGSTKYSNRNPTWGLRIHIVRSLHNHSNFSMARWSYIYVSMIYTFGQKWCRFWKCSSGSNNSFSIKLPASTRCHWTIFSVPGGLTSFANV